MTAPTAIESADSASLEAIARFRIDAITSTRSGITAPAATTPAATITALEAFDRPAVVILGGVGKGADFNGLAKEVARRARAAVLIGQAADDIAAALAVAGKGKFPMIRASSLAEAVKKASALAQPGDVVLLSPACASFDMFDSYEERGDSFRAAVKALTEMKQ